MSGAQSRGEAAPEFEFTPPDGETELFTVDKDFLHAVGSKSGFSNPFPIRRHDGALQVAHVYEQLTGDDTQNLVPELSAETPVVADFSLKTLEDFQEQLNVWLSQRVSEPEEKLPEPGTEGLPLLADRVGGGIPVVSPETGEPAPVRHGQPMPDDAAPAVRPEEVAEPAGLLDVVRDYPQLVQPLLTEYANSQPCAGLYIGYMHLWTAAADTTCRFK